MNRKENHVLTEEEKLCLDAVAMDANNLDLAYKMSRKTQSGASEENLHKLALRWMKHPVVKAYLGQRKTGVTMMPNDSKGRFRDKDAILSELESTLPNLSGKEKADVLMKIADLQQMKKEEDETKTEDRTVHYYLPLNCLKCGLYQKHKKGLVKNNNI